MPFLMCPLCGPLGTETHPRHPTVTRCVNCKEWLGVDVPPH